MQEVARAVPQGVIGLFTRVGMNVSLAHAEGYTLMPDVMEKAREFPKASGGSFSIADAMELAFEGAHVVYPKSWAPFAVMARTANALYLHCLPAGITGINCARGEVSAEVFGRFRTPLYRQAGWRPHIIAAMIFASRIPDAREKLSNLLDRAESRVIG